MGLRVLVCTCSGAQVVDHSKAQGVAQGCADAGFKTLVVGDLCGRCATRDAELLGWLGAGVDFVVACHSRAVRWLLDWAGCPVDQAQLLDLRSGGGATGVEEALGITCAPGGADAPRPGGGTWAPWFPVVDRSRCTRCRQCLSFCPFGVYEGRADGGVDVVHPENCKDNCPACARVCPDVAIIFPKLKDRPINGDSVTGADVARVREVLAEQDGDGDIHDILAMRKRRAAYRKLERMAQAEGRALSTEELERGMTTIGTGSGS